jgi:hypothetical protein
MLHMNKTLRYSHLYEMLERVYNGFGVRSTAFAYGMASGYSIADNAYDCDLDRYLGLVAVIAEAKFRELGA